MENFNRCLILDGEENYKICKIVGDEENVDAAQKLILEFINPEGLEIVEMWVPQVNPKNNNFLIVFLFK